MSLDADTSILEDALACINQRITSILTKPVANKDINYTTSLRNEVVGLS
jgi:hypothetical protein